MARRSSALTLLHLMPMANKLQRSIVLTDAGYGCASQRIIARHRMVNDALKQEFDEGLHALVIKAKSPKEADKQ